MPEPVREAAPPSITRSPLCARRLRRTLGLRGTGFDLAFLPPLPSEKEQDEDDRQEEQEKGPPALAEEVLRRSRPLDRERSAFVPALSASRVDDGDVHHHVRRLDVGKGPLVGLCSLQTGDDLRRESSRRVVHVDGEI